MKRVCLALALGACTALGARGAGAQPEPRSVEIGEVTVQYDTSRNVDTDFDGKLDGVGYYRGGRLVASALDDDGDGRHDLWLTYDDTLQLALELVDRDRDGEPDVSRKLSATESVLEETQLSDSPLPKLDLLGDWRVLAGAGLLLVFGAFFVAVIGFLLLRRGRAR